MTPCPQCHFRHEHPGVWESECCRLGVPRKDVMGQVSGWNGEPFTREGLMVRLQKFIVGDDVPPHFSCVSDRQMIPTGLPIVGPPFGSLHLAFRVPGSLPGLISPFLHLPHHEYPPPRLFLAPTSFGPRFLSCLWSPSIFMDRRRSPMMTT